MPLLFLVGESVSILDLPIMKLIMLIDLSYYILAAHAKSGCW